MQPFGMVCHGGGTTPCARWHCSLPLPEQLCICSEPFGTWGSVCPGVVAILYVRKAQVFELDGA